MIAGFTLPGFTRWADLRRRRILAAFMVGVLLSTAGAAAAATDTSPAAFPASAIQLRSALPVAAGLPSADAWRRSPSNTPAAGDQSSTFSATIRNAENGSEGLRKPVSTSPAQAPVTIATVTGPVAPAAAPAHIAVTAAAAPVAGYGCAAALSYLREHAAPGFELLCPGDAHGHQAMTCVNTAPQCPGRLIIAINTPCAAAYMNEASNSWVLIGLRTSRIDPYGHC